MIWVSDLPQKDEVNKQKLFLQLQFLLGQMQNNFPETLRQVGKKYFTLIRNPFIMQVDCIYLI